MLKLSCITVIGYSPNQLAFGKNLNFPSVLIDNPPALEGQTSSEVIANHLNMIAATVIARENKQILIKYGGTYLKVYAWRLQYVKDVKMLPECERG